MFEIAQMKILGFHPNIVSLVGCCTLLEQKILVIEYVPFGDLLQWLRRRRRMVGKFLELYLTSSILRIAQVKIGKQITLNFIIYCC